MEGQIRERDWEDRREGRETVIWLGKLITIFKKEIFEV